jgi:hypothetical protein
MSESCDRPERRAAKPRRRGAIGMANRQEVEIQTWGPDGGNPTPIMTRALTRRTESSAEVVQKARTPNCPRGSVWWKS